MPRYNIWIREADNDKWLAIDDKPQFMSDAINARRVHSNNRDYLINEVTKPALSPYNQMTSNNGQLNSVIRDVEQRMTESFDDPTYTDVEEVA